jgi:hypothetical protein
LLDRAGNGPSGCFITSNDLRMKTIYYLSIHPLFVTYFSVDIDRPETALVSWTATPEGRCFQFINKPIKTIDCVGIANSKLYEITESQFFEAWEKTGPSITSLLGQCGAPGLLKILR